MNSLNLSRGRCSWLAVVTTVLVVTAVTVWGPVADRRWEHPGLLLGVLTTAATLGIVAATIVTALADRREMAEVGLLGSALLTASVLPLVHGLTTPGVLFGETAAFRSSTFLTLPIAAVVAAPLFASRSSLGHWAARHWRDWTLLSLVGVFVLGSWIGFFPDAIVSPAPGDPVTIVMAGAMLFAFGSLSIRQFRLYEFGRQASNLIASLSLAAVGVTALLPMVESDYSPAFWLLHVIGSVGVLGACVGLGVSSSTSRSTRDLLEPVVTRDPLAAFELGLSPVVHRFVADLDDKDRLTRDHTLRTGEMAIRVGERFRLPARDLRELGLAAMLHDVGKLHVPDELLGKPGRLTPAEYEMMQQHPVAGEAMLAAEPALAGAAHIVRSHHERLDGAGYPDGLRGREIPLAARIIAVCDAFDAMTHSRPYRSAMSFEMAHAVLREHAGAQWDAAVIDQVMAVAPLMPAVSTFDEVGRPAGSADASPVVPDDLGDLPATVDAEI